MWFYTNWMANSVDIDGAVWSVYAVFIIAKMLNLTDCFVKSSVITNYINSFYM